MDTFAPRFDTELTEVLEGAAVELLVFAGRLRHVSPQYLALAVPGLCHTHNPCQGVQPGCLYCQRHGNAFAVGEAAQGGPGQ